MPSISLIPVSESEKPVLWKLLQSYLAELSTLGGDGPLDGVYPYRYFDAYWHEAERWPLWIRSDGQTAGFAMVRRQKELGEKARIEMAEFYVEPAHRRGKIGLFAARAIFARFPGKWELSEFTANAGAIAFWRRVLAGFADYTEIISGGRIVQLFEVAASG